MCCVFAFNNDSLVFVFVRVSYCCHIFYHPLFVEVSNYYSIFQHPEKSPAFQAELPVPFDCTWTSEVIHIATYCCRLCSDSDLKVDLL